MAADDRSRALLTRLQTLPRLTVPVVTLVLVLVALMASPALALAAVTALLLILGWLTSISWADADRRGRLIRVVVIGALGYLWLVRLSELFD